MCPYVVEPRAAARPVLHVPSSLASTVLQRNFSHDGALTHDITAHFFRVISFPSAPPASLLRPQGWALACVAAPGAWVHVQTLCVGVSPPAGAPQRLFTKQRPLPGSRPDPDCLPDPVPLASDLCSGRLPVFSGVFLDLVQPGVCLGLPGSVIQGKMHQEQWGQTTGVAVGLLRSLSVPGAVHAPPPCSVLTGAERGLLLCWPGCRPSPCWPGLLMMIRGWGSHAGFLTPSQFCQEGGRCAFPAELPGRQWPLAHGSAAQQGCPRTGPSSVHIPCPPRMRMSVPHGAALGLK